jgi:hypothetical protein
MVVSWEWLVSFGAMKEEAGELGATGAQQTTTDDKTSLNCRSSYVRVLPRQEQLLVHVFMYLCLFLGLIAVEREF